MPSINLSFRAPDPLLKDVQSRDPKALKNPGSVAKRDLERWYALLAEALRDVELSPAQAVLLIRLIGQATEPIEDLVASLPDYVERNPQEGFQHVQRGLVRVLSTYGLATRWALVDAVERYEVLIRRSPVRPGFTVGMALHLVGLHSYIATPEELAALEATTAVAPADLSLIGSES